MLETLVIIDYHRKWPSPLGSAGLILAAVGMRATTPLHLRGDVLREEARVDPTGPIVLVADDDPSVRQLVALALELDGFTVVAAADGREAYERACSYRPAAVVLDAVMPHLSGMEVSRLLRAELGPETAVLMLTGRTDVADRVAAFEAGADDYVVKPVRVTELVERVKRRLHRSPGALTGRLLGSPELYGDLQRRMQAAEATSVIYVEINGLRAFSRCYSFTRAERLLEWVGELLLLLAGNHTHTIAGRLGADNFLVLTPPEAGGDITDDLVSRFAEGVASFYDKRDATRGWIEVTDRVGLARRFRLMSLSVGVASTPSDRPGHHLEVIERAAEMARYAGVGGDGSRVAFDRRA